MPSLHQRLLALPAPEFGEVNSKDWYAGHGFNAKDAEKLIEQLFDLELPGDADSEEQMEYQLLHAWSIVGLFGGSAGLDFLLGELRSATGMHDDFFTDSFSDLVLAIGGEALSAVIEALGNPEEDELTRIELAVTLSASVREGIQKDLAMKTLVECLADAVDHRGLKGIIIADLVELKAEQALPAIRKAFDDNLVDVTIPGDLEQVEIDLGQREERSGVAPNWRELEDELVRLSRLERIGPPPADGDDAAILSYCLQRYRGPDSLADFAELDGLVLGAVLAPSPVMPSRLCPSIWDPEGLDWEPAWETTDDATRFFSALMNWQNRIIHALDSGSYHPPLVPRVNPETATKEEQSWARGILKSCLFWSGSDTEPSETHRALLGCAAHLANPRADIPPDEHMLVVHVVRAASMLRAENLSGHPSDGPPIFDAGSPILSFERDEPKVGRNDPCPCGSGRKYKRCCMN
jgi:uncharacterized protein